MSATDQELREISEFIRSGLTAFIKDEKPAFPVTGLNWRELQRIVRGRNLEPLFAFYSPSQAIPPPIMQEWQQRKMTTSLNNLARLKVTTDISAIAEKAGIQAVAMRGIVLAHTLYPDPAMRPMHDIDFIIRPSDRKRFLAAMREAGHEPTDFFRSQYIYKIRDVIVEVHWQLLSNKRYRKIIDSDALVTSSARQNTETGWYYSLQDTWEIIGLVVHAFTHHNLSQIYSLIDIGLYMQNKEVDWQEIGGWSNKMNISKMMCLTLGFVSHFFSLNKENILVQFFGQNRKNISRYYAPYLEQTMTRMGLATHIGIKQSQFFVAESPANKLREFIRLFSAKELRFLKDQLREALRENKQKLKA